MTNQTDTISQLESSAQSLPALIDGAESVALRNRLMGIGVSIIHQLRSEDAQKYAGIYASNFLKSSIRQLVKEPQVQLSEGLAKGWSPIIANAIVTLMMSRKTDKRTKSFLAQVGEQVIISLPERTRDAYSTLFTFLNFRAYDDQSVSIGAVTTLGRLLKEYRKDGLTIGETLLLKIRDSLEYVSEQGSLLLRTYARGYLDHNYTLWPEIDPNNVSGKIPSPYTSQVTSITTAIQDGDTDAIPLVLEIIPNMLPRERRELASAIVKGIEANLSQLTRTELRAIRRAYDLKTKIGLPDEQNHYAKVQKLARVGLHLSDNFLDETAYPVYTPIFHIYSIITDPRTYPNPAKKIPQALLSLGVAIKASKEGGPRVTTISSVDVFNLFMRIMHSLPNSQAAQMCVRYLGFVDHPDARKLLQMYTRHDNTPAAIKGTAAKSLISTSIQQGALSQPLPGTFKSQQPQARAPIRARRARA